MDVALITTYNRPRMCLDLLRALHAEGIYAVVINDCSDEQHDYSVVEDFCASHRESTRYVKRAVNGGKTGYCDVVNEGLAHSKAAVSGLSTLWFLQDDTVLAPGDVDKIRAAWTSLSRRSKGSLLLFAPSDIHNNPACAPWSNQAMVPVPDREDIEVCNYFDNSGLISRRALDAIQWRVKVPTADWHDAHQHEAQSGFGMNMTMQLVAQNYKMYRATRGHALAGTALVASQMHPEERTERTTAVEGATVTLSPVVGVVATMESRRALLPKMLKTIVHQCDRFVVHVNDYEPTDDELAKLAELRTATGASVELRLGPDLKDNAKFVLPDDAGECYHLTFDDDLLYPADYARRMVQQIETLGRKHYVCVHARRFGNDPKVRYVNTKSYYFGSPLKEATQVDMPGTGTGAYHTSAIVLAGERFLTVKMSDLEVAARCAFAGVPVTAIARGSNWITQIAHKGPRIWDDVLKFDSAQTNMLRQHWPWPTNGLVAAPRIEPKPTPLARTPQRTPQPKTQFTPPARPATPGVVVFGTEPRIAPPIHVAEMARLVATRKHESVLWPDWSVYDWKQYSRDVEAMLTPIAHTIRDSVVLDLGCGWGKWWPALSASGASDIVGVDTCEAVLALRPDPKRLLWDERSALPPAKVVFIHDVLRCLSDAQVCDLLRKVKVDLPKAKLVVIERVGTSASPYRTSAAWTALLAPFGLAVKVSTTVGRPGRRTTLQLFS